MRKVVFSWSIKAKSNNENLVDYDKKYDHDEHDLRFDYNWQKS